MAKPTGITLGIVGAKKPLPPEAVIAHAKPLQVEITEPPVEPARPKRSKKTAAVEEVAVAESSETAEAETAPVIKLTVPAEGEG